MSTRLENSTTLGHAANRVDDLQDYCIYRDWDDDTTYRFLMQVSLYARDAAEQYKPEWPR